MKKQLKEILKMVKSLEKSNDEQTNKETFKKLKKYINDTLDELEFKAPDLSLMSLEEVEKLICNGLETPAIVRQMQTQFNKNSEIQQETMQAAYNILRDVDFRLSEDEDDATVDERIDAINDAMSDFADSVGVSYEDGQFREPSSYF